jgi:hypothetical protein
MVARRYDPIIQLPHLEDRMRNSYLSNVARMLKGKPAFMGFQKYYALGSEMHKRILQPSEERTLFEPEDELKLAAMCQAAAEDAALQKLMHLTPEHKREVLKWTVIDGLMISGQLDLPVYQFLHVEDLKSTVAKSEKEFLEASRKYDYFRQAWIYKKFGFKTCSFTGIQKVTRDAKVYKLPADDYPHLLQEGEEQARLLIDTIKVLGRIQYKAA